MNNMLEILNAVNDVPVLSVFDPAFAPYGRVLEGCDFSRADEYMLEKTDIPENGNIYVPSVPELEESELKSDIENTLYGSMPVQIGFCNGRNTPVERPDVEIIKRGVVMLRIGGRRSDKTKPPSVQDTAEVELWRPQRGSNPR